MGRKILLLLIICILMVSSAWATIPLVLEQTLQLPPCTSWDVQHWMDTNTFGYAYLRADTVYWAAHVGDAEQIFQIPDSIYLEYGFGHPNHEKVCLARLASSANRLTVFLESAGRVYDYELAYYWFAFCFFDISNGALISKSVFPAGSWAPDYNYVNVSASTLRDFLFSPAPPLASTSLVVARPWIHYLDIYEGGTTLIWSDGDILYFNTASLNPVVSRLGNGTNARVFALPDSEEYAAFYHYYDCWNTDLREITTFGSDHVMAMWDINTAFDSLQAQCDGDGTRRLIVDCGDGTRALSPTNYSLLWSDSDHICDEVARLAGNPDERLFRRDGTTFRVYNAADGSYLDRTTDMSGELKYIIRSPTRNSDFVTYDNNTRMVRVYTTLKQANGLTCTYLPGTGTVRLRWQAAAGATRYLIYVSSSASVPPWPLASVPAGTLTYDVPISQDRSFFQVTAEYGP